MKKQKIIINLVAAEINQESPANDYINNQFNFVSKTFYTYLKQCKKQNKRAFGTYQFIPSYEYGAILFKHIDENSISTDYVEDYIVNMYVKKMVDGKDWYDFKAIKSIMPEIARKVNDVLGNDYELVINADKSILGIKKFLVEQINHTFHKYCNFILIEQDKNEDILNSSNDIDYEEYDYEYNN